MEKIHFSKGRETKAICDDKKFGAIGFDMENKEQMFFDRDITERCPYCERILLREKNESLKKLLDELGESCQKIVDAIRLS